MKKENLYLIHGEDYLRHIEEKMELFWMTNVLLNYIHEMGKENRFLDHVRRATQDYAERCEELFERWGSAVNYMETHDVSDLSEFIDNDLIEPEYAGYVPTDKPCCPGERCCEYAERIERKYAAKRDAGLDADDEDFDGAYEYDYDYDDEDEYDDDRSDCESDAEGLFDYLEELLAIADETRAAASDLLDTTSRLLAVVDREIREYCAK